MGLWEMASRRTRVMFLLEYLVPSPGLRLQPGRWERGQACGGRPSWGRVCVHVCECMHVCGAAGACVFTPVEGSVHVCTCVGSARAAVDPRRPRTSPLSLGRPPLQTKVGGWAS